MEETITTSGSSNNKSLSWNDFNPDYEGSFMWAVEKMKEGKKVRRSVWSGSVNYIRFRNDGLMVDGLGKDMRFFNLNNDFEATDWEIYYENPKSLSDDIYTHPIGSIRMPDSVPVDKIRLVLKRLKILDIKNISQIEYITFINKLFGDNLI